MVSTGFLLFILLSLDVDTLLLPRQALVFVSVSYFPSISLFLTSPCITISISLHCCVAFSSSRPAPWSTVSVVRRSWVCVHNSLSSPLHTGLRDETNTTTDRWGSSESSTVCMCEGNRSFLSGHKRNLLKAAIVLCLASLNTMLLLSLGRT